MDQEASGEAPARSLSPTGPGPADSNPASTDPGSESALLQIEPAGIHLLEDEQEILSDECALVLAQALPVDARATFERLEEAVEAGTVPEALFEPLQNLVEVGLESGRIRRLHAPHAEMAVTRLYGRLPRGKAYRASIAAANDALKTLHGGVIRTASLEASGPGACALTIEAGDWRIRLRISRAGAIVQTVEAVL